MGVVRFPAAAAIPRQSTHAQEMRAILDGLQVLALQKPQTARWLIGWLKLFLACNVLSP